MKMLNLAFRTDASQRIGFGHLFRCLALADRISEQLECKISFVCNGDLPEILFKMIILKGYKANLLPGDIVKTEIEDAVSFLEVISAEKIDWLFIDHYKLGLNWETFVRASAENIVVIDDLDDRKHLCDVVINQNVLDQGKKYYLNRVPPSCILLLGPANIMFNPLFLKARSGRRIRTKLGRLLISFGGSDPTNETAKAMEMLESGIWKWQVDLVVGAGYRYVCKIEAQCRYLTNVTLHKHTNRMADLILGADMAIGSGGISLWERFLLGLPSMVVQAADNQRELIEFTARQGQIWPLGESRLVTPDTMSQQLMDIMKRPELLAEQSEKIMAYMDALEPSNLPIIKLMMEQLVRGNLR